MRTKSVSKAYLEQLYCGEGKSLQDIADIIGCSRQNVMFLLRNNGIDRRSRSHARVLAVKGGKFDSFSYDEVNEEFFSVWTPQMAWVLGLFFTDGYIMESGKGLRVALTSVDKDMLSNVRNHMQSQRPIEAKEQKAGRQYIYSLQFFRERLRHDLLDLGLFQRKSLTMCFPNVPEPFVRHFIRGCWDGDGSIYIGRNAKVNASYISGSKDFVKILVKELAKKDIRKQDGSQLSIFEDKRSVAFTIKLNSEKNLRLFFHYLYDGVPETMRLERKYLKLAVGLGLSTEEMKTAENMVHAWQPISIERGGAVVVENNELENSQKSKKAHSARRSHEPKKHLRIQNLDGKLNCHKCGKAAPLLYLRDQYVCPSCLSF